MDRAQWLLTVKKLKKFRKLSVGGIESLKELVMKIILKKFLKYTLQKTF